MDPGCRSENALIESLSKPQEGIPDLRYGDMQVASRVTQVRCWAAGLAARPAERLCRWRVGGVRRGALGRGIILR